MAAPYQGHTLAQWRAVCPQHHIMSDVLPSHEAAEIAAADTRAFCPACVLFEMRTKALQNRLNNLEVERG